MRIKRKVKRKKSDDMKKNLGSFYDLNISALIKEKQSKCWTAPWKSPRSCLIPLCQFRLTHEALCFKLPSNYANTWVTGYPIRLFITLLSPVPTLLQFPKPSPHFVIDSILSWFCIIFLSIRLFIMEFWCIGSFCQRFIFSFAIFRFCS